MLYIHTQKRKGSVVLVFWLDGWIRTENVQPNHIRPTKSELISYELLLWY
jgi:hypothetical protein